MFKEKTPRFGGTNGCGAAKMGSVGRGCSRHRRNHFHDPEVSPASLVRNRSLSGHRDLQQDDLLTAGCSHLDQTVSQELAQQNGGKATLDQHHLRVAVGVMRKEQEILRDIRSMDRRPQS
jgi:hypothetical protein